MVDSRKESFQLLQLSDDSKSLSDLEPPEFLPQRKRKIRRKTRNTGNHVGRHIDGHSSHHHHQNDSTPAVCQNLGLWIAIFMSCGWLLILSYMTTVVYTENRRLETQISKLSINSLNIPDVLQKWHETTKYLNGNQTIVNEKLYGIQKRMDGLEKELNDVQNRLTEQHNLIINREKSDDQQTKEAVGTFGAKIKDISIGIKDLKERMEQLKLDTEQNRNNITTLSNKLSNTTLPLDEQITNATAHLFANTTDFINNQLTNLTRTLFTVNDTLSQRVNGLSDDIRADQSQLDKLRDNVTSLSTQIISLRRTHELNSNKKMDENVNVPPPSAPITNDGF